MPMCLVAPLNPTERNVVSNTHAGEPRAGFVACARRMVAAIALVVMVGLASPARADDFVDQANAGFKGIPNDRRSDVVLVPLLAKMQPQPGLLKSQEQAALRSHYGAGWEASAAWATGDTQKACLAGLEQVTKETDHRKAFVFAQPYGVEGVDPDTVATGLYTELGETPTLAGATIGVLPALERLGILVHVEASRRSKEGDFKGALDLLLTWANFCRQYADRPFASEKSWALDSLMLAMTRMRDVLHEDYSATDHKLDMPYVKAFLEKMPLDGYLSMTRLRPPEADSIGRRQLINRVLKKTGGADPSFGPTMARITSVDRPLRLFSNSAYWETVGSTHRDFAETDRLLTAITQDWAKRWDLSPFDPVQQTKSDYVLKVQSRPNLGLLTFGFERNEQLRFDRQRCRVEIAGTRMSLAIYGYMLRDKALPPALGSTRPSIVANLDKDAYSSGNTDLVYKIAGRDNPKGPDGQPRAFNIKLFPPEPYPEFEVPILPGNFFLYSVGPNNVNESMLEATQGRQGVRGDYLIWPAALTLYRQRLMDTSGLN